jgi:secreted protein with Ig-like and vWFA domain
MHAADFSGYDLSNIWELLMKSQAILITCSCPVVGTACAIVFFCCAIQQSVAFQNVSMPVQSPTPFYTPGSPAPEWLRDSSEDDAALAKLQEALDKKVTFQFDNLTLTQAMDELENQVGVAIAIDIAKLNEDGISMDEPLYLQLTEVPLRQALKTILQPLGLAYSTKRKYWLTITTSSDATRNIIQTYNVSTLAANATETTHLVQLIQNTVDGRWDEGTDTIEVLGQVLVVSAPDNAQETLRDLLNQLSLSQRPKQSTHPEPVAVQKSDPANPQADKNVTGSPEARSSHGKEQQAHEMDLAAREKLVEALNTKETFHLSGMLPNVLEQLENICGAEFRLDLAGFVEEGLDPNQMVEFSVDTEIPVRVLLSSILKPLSLTYSLHQNYWVEITTEARASSNSVQVFDLSYVLPNSYFATNLLFLISHSIEGRWDEGSDTLEIIGSSLVVSAPEETLHAVSQLLHKLSKSDRLNFVGPSVVIPPNVQSNPPVKNPANLGSGSPNKADGQSGIGMGGMGGGGMGGTSGMSDIGGGSPGAGGGGNFQSESSSGDRFANIEGNQFQSVTAKPLSTFSIDVDTASFSKIRQNLLENKTLPPADAVRIEEMVNYFEYNYEEPKNAEPFAASLAVANCPWEPDHQLVRIALQARGIDTSSRPDSNLVFLLDVSGSMGAPNKLPLVQESIGLLVNQLRDNDRVAIVVYAGAAGLVLESTRGSEKKTITAALESLSAGGSTNGGEGIELAYRLARENFIEGGTNRIILCTDGDFNVGITETKSLVDLVAANAKANIFLTVLGFGMGNTNDEMMERISNDGNGIYGFVDSELEARRMMVEQLSGSLVTVAKDVKLQVEFNPAKVAQYRLVGYENRLLSTADFKNDRKDAGDIGSGHSVTALYEIVRAGSKDDEIEPLRYSKTAYQSNGEHDSELLTVKMRYKEPEGETSSLLEFPLVDKPIELDACDQDFRWAAAMAQFGMLLRKSEQRGDSSWTTLQECAIEAAGEAPDKYRQLALEMISQAIQLDQQ